MAKTAGGYQVRIPVPLIAREGHALGPTQYVVTYEGKFSKRNGYFTTLYERRVGTEIVYEMALTIGNCVSNEDPVLKYGGVKHECGSRHTRNVPQGISTVRFIVHRYYKDFILSTSMGE